MAVQLEIRDGDPWWLSPDVWTVPGDPEGTPAPPIAGSPCFLWARVRNNGETGVTNATVRFYWANPASGFDRTTATPIGTSFVSLSPGAVSNVLCLTPWIPVIVNDGHECVLAEAFHGTFDPLSSGLAFNVSTDRHVAQRNLNVVQAPMGFFHLAFELHNTSRRARRFDVRIVPGTLASLRPIVEHFKQIEPVLGERDGAGEAGLLKATCPTEADLKDAHLQIDALEIAANGRVGLTIAGRVEGPAALFHLEQRDGRQLVGGLSVLVMRRDEKPASRRYSQKQ